VMAIPSIFNLTEVIMGLSLSHLLIILLIILVLFGAGKLPQVMSELGRGVKALRDGMKSDSHEDDKPKKISKPKGKKK
jgi:sec-independent protein translocase protein TatA